MKRLLHIYFIFSVIKFSGQSIDSTNSLKPFIKTTNSEIKDGKFSKTEKITNLSEIRNNENLGDILEGQSINYIKNYGPSNLSSISSRGGNAQQTSVIYKDFILNNPLNGIVDFSSIPAVFFNTVNIIYGLPSSNWGNGGVAGAVLLENVSNKDYNQYLEYGNTFGSFNQKTNYLKFGLNNKKIISEFKIYHQNSLNNFTFNSTNNETTEQKNAQIKNLSYMGETKLLINSNNNLSLIYFGQNLDREIPPSIFEGYTNAKQIDNNHRVFLNYTHLGNKNKLNLKSAYYNEKNNYLDSARSINSQNPCESYINQVEFKTMYEQNHNFTFNLTNSYSTSNGLNYEEKVKINRTALTGCYIFQNKGWNQLLNVRFLLNDQNITPLTFSYALSKKVNDKSIFLNFGKVFRLPSINDLYWNPGGNVELLPEQGYSSDLGLKWNIKTNNYQINFSPSIYSRWIDNWIQWQPNGNYWSALNIKEVWSRGIETNTNLITEFKHVEALFNLKTAYNMSTNSELFNENPSLLGKQLTYCPHYKAVFKASFTYKKFHITYLHNYTGYRFTSSDNSYFLPAFHLGRLFLSSDFKVKKQSIKIFYKLNNLYNVDYQLIINRPMPLINQEIGLNIKINK